MHKVQTIEKKMLRVPELADLLRGIIEKEQIPGGAPIDSTRKLADRYGVSPVTANRAINELVEQQVLYRVPGKGTFVSKNRSWRNSKARIGFYPYQGYKHHTKDYYLGIGFFYQTLGNLLKQNGYHLSMISGIEKNDLAILRQTLESTDALMLNKDFINSTNTPLLCSYPRQIIMVDSSSVSDKPFHQVVPDPFRGFRKAADHFAALGVKKVQIMGVADTETHQSRRKSIRQVMQIFHPGIALPEDMTHNQLPEDFGQGCGRILGRRYLELPDRPAIFSVCDYVSFGIMEVLLDAGLKPGKDFKLISYNNLEAGGICPFDKPLLTTVEYPYQQLGNELIKLLGEVLAAPTDNIRIVRVPADKLIIRSTA
jgi:DNA-binding LacI/PurR family transcriptional regulator